RDAKQVRGRAKSWPAWDLPFGLRFVFRKRSTGNTCSAAPLHSWKGPLRPKRLPRDCAMSFFQKKVNRVFSRFFWRSASRVPLFHESLELSWLVLGRTARTNQGIRPPLDGIGKFLQVFRDVTEIFQQFVDILGVDIERLVELACQGRHSCQ